MLSWQTQPAFGQVNGQERVPPQPSPTSPQYSDSSDECTQRRLVQTAVGPVQTLFRHIHPVRGQVSPQSRVWPQPSQIVPQKLSPYSSVQATGTQASPAESAAASVPPVSAGASAGLAVSGGLGRSTVPASGTAASVFVPVSAPAFASSRPIPPSEDAGFSACLLHPRRPASKTAARLTERLTRAFL